jgi:hypothetical protein
MQTEQQQQQQQIANLQKELQKQVHGSFEEINEMQTEQ